MSRRPVALVTGSSRGLGRAFAVALAAAGHDLVVNGTSTDALGETVDLVTEAGARAVPVLGSVADADVCQRLVDQAVGELGGLDVVVNNAGVTRDRSIHKMTAPEFDEVVAVHLRGTWAVGAAAARVMREQRSGAIVNVTSGSGLFGMFGQANYAAAKAGIVGLTRVMHLELGRFGIRCNALAPVAETDMTGIFDPGADEGVVHARRFPPPELVAPVVVHLASDRARHVAGQVLSFDGTALAVWTHPDRSSVAEPGSPWTAADFDAALDPARLESLHPDEWGSGVTAT